MWLVYYACDMYITPVMNHSHEPETELDLRKRIAALVATERRARTLSQAALAAELGVSQAHLSNVERGRASFTAEQLLYLLRRFNLGLETLLPVVDEGAAAQNALLHHGAWHLAHIPAAGAPRYQNVNDLVVHVLCVPEPRHVTALLPVFLHSVRRISLPSVQEGLSQAHVAGRLRWFLDMVKAAVGPQQSIPPRYQLPAREVLMVIELAAHAAVLESDHIDAFDPSIRSVQTARELLAEGDPISKRHRIATSLRVADFVDAMLHADLARP